METNTIISSQTILRLPRYLHYLEEQKMKGKTHVSSIEIASALDVKPTQVRQDLGVFGNFGVQGYGYNVPDLCDEIRKILGLDIRHRIAVVGAGCIGRALLEHLDYGAYNYEVLVAFEVQEELIGTTINGVPVLNAAEMNTWFGSNEVDICILAVPASSARSVAYQLSSFGVPAIWNFTSVDLNRNDMNCIVQNVDFRNSLFTLTYYLENGK